jgi:cation:H+ antiporter
LIPEVAGRKEIPRLLVTTGLATALLYDGNLSRFDGLVLTAALIVMMVVLIRGVRRDERGGDAPSIEGGPRRRARRDADRQPGARMKSGLAVLLGLALLLAGSKSVVWGAADIARALGVSDFVIGLTVVAIGTSLPELASTIFAARRGEAELVVGNIVGSNTFNTLAVLGIPGVLSPLSSVGPSLIPVDLPVMLLLTAMLGAVGWRAHQRGEARVGRRWGIALLTVFVVHAAWTAMSASGV